MFSLGAMGIGALIGALGSKQRGGNLVKGALTGAALGGIGGMLGNKFGIGGAGTKAGGLFGFGQKMMPNALALAGIGMGTEMLGQQEANAAALAGRRRWLDEEEERRIARLNKIAGYDVADSKNFLTPNKFFGLARGGIAQLPGYEMGGEVIEEMGEEVAMSEPHPMEGWHDMYSNMIGSGEIPSSMSFDEFMEEIVPQLDIDIPMAARGGRIHAKDGMYLDEGFQYDFDIDGDKYDFSFNEMLREATPAMKTLPGPDQEGFIMVPGPDGEMIKVKPAMKTLPGPDQEGFMMVPGPDGKMIKVKPAFRGIGGEEMAQGGIARVHAKDGLWANIHAKRKRIAGGSGEKMRSPGSAGAPTDEALRQSQATGGIADLDMRGGGHSIGPGTGTSDDVPAMLSDGEFVVTAKAVENLGGGDRMEGAKRMYSMMNRLDPNSQTPGEMNYVGHG